MKRGFTLLELLVVISVISMLSSVILANTSTARAKGRDSQRTQQIRQIDLATRLYIQDNGHAPDLNGTCKAQSSSPTPEQESACFVVSTSAFNWDMLAEDLKPYIASLPQDPCPNCISDQTEYPLGYTYVSPLALQYNCALNCPSLDELNRSYQLYAPLEKKTLPVGSTQDSGQIIADNFQKKAQAPVTPPPDPTPNLAVRISNGTETMIVEDESNNGFININTMFATIWQVNLSVGNEGTPESPVIYVNFVTITSNSINSTTAPAPLTVEVSLKGFGPSTDSQQVNVDQQGFTQGSVDENVYLDQSNAIFGKTTSLFVFNRASDGAFSSYNNNVPSPNASNYSLTMSTTFTHPAGTGLGKKTSSMSANIIYSNL